MFTAPMPADSVDIDVSVQYYPKRCPKSKAMQTIRANLIKQFEQLARDHALPEFCDVTTSCKVENVELECGRVTDTSNRKRRQANSGNVVLKIAFKVSVGPSDNEADLTTVSLILCNYVLLKSTILYRFSRVIS